LEEIVMTLKIRSAAFQQGKIIPVQYTGDGADLPPPLQWIMPPLGTKSFALICDDPDAPRQAYTHWIVFNLPVGTDSLPEGATANAGLPDGTKQRTNNFEERALSTTAPKRCRRALLIEILN
jgi:Raf kinase inhibitor-like YbhB/YbcL family protein